MDEDKQYALTYKCIVFLSIYYIFLLAASVGGLIYIIHFEYMHYEKIEEIPLSFLGSSITSLLGSLIYYIRKIYLASIFNCIRPEHKYTKIQKWGTVLYFFIRPFFSSIISVMIIMGISAGIFTIFSNQGAPSKSLVNISLVVAFFLGVSNGTLVDKLDKIGKGFISKIIN